MVDMHSKYDNMDTNGMFYALICINNHIIICYQLFLVSLSCMVQCNKVKGLAQSMSGRAIQACKLHNNKLA